MAQSLVGSRYELKVSREGASDSKAARDYYAVQAADVEDIDAGGDITGYVHSYEVGSTVDGPGIRFVAFLTGCLLRCQYCHNPDTWHKHNGHPVTVARAMGTIGKYAKVLKLSKGGVTLSGGEPVVQRAFAMQIFRRCKALGLHTALDTSGRLGERLSDDDLMQIDLNILDVPGMHRVVIVRGLALGRPFPRDLELVPAADQRLGHGGSLGYIAPWNVRLMTSSCCSLVSLTKLTA
jgi:pyruvate formate lyase activating enzyme